MAFNAAVVGGTFALSGVVLQQAFTVLTERRRAKRDQARELRLQRINAYTEMITRARRIQRTLKESSDGVNSNNAEDRLPEDFNHLAESVAAVRLLASESTFEAVERFETAAQSIAKRDPERRAHPEEHVRLAPLVEALREDLKRDELDALLA